MRGLWLEGRQPRLREDLPMPVPGPGEALVRMRLAGICATDLELLKGYYPFTGIPGHEFVGEIAALGPEVAASGPEIAVMGPEVTASGPEVAAMGLDVASSGPEIAALGPEGAPRDASCQDPEPAEASAWPIGQRVVGEINLPCGHCLQCRAGRGRHCLHRRVLGLKGQDGAFAEYLVLPLANLHRVPACLPDEAAVFCEPLAAALRIQEQRPIAPGERVLVVGAGRLGQLIALSLGGGHPSSGVDQQGGPRPPGSRTAMRTEMHTEMHTEMRTGMCTGAQPGMYTEVSIGMQSEMHPAMRPGIPPGMPPEVPPGIPLGIPSEMPSPGSFTIGVVARHPRQRDLLAARGIRWLSEDQVVPGAWDVVIEASGAPGGFDLARRALRAAGTLILKSTYATQAEIDLSSLVVDEISLLGSRCGRFAPALAALGQGLDPRPLIDGRFPLAQGLHALAAAARPGVMKILIEGAGQD